MDNVANTEIVGREERRTVDTPTSGAFRDMKHADASAAAPTPSDLARLEKYAILVAAVMTLSPLAAAAWGAFHPA